MKKFQHHSNVLFPDRATVTMDVAVRIFWKFLQVRLRSKHGIQI
ncbi:hypothetical protein [Lentibacillus cibarius]|nr:hypothetical protein [Lentibacillus cibarius]